MAARVALDGSQATLIPLLTRPLTASLLSDGDLLVSSPQGVGRLDVDALGQPWDQLSAQDQLALVRAWPLGHPAELSERLIQLLQADPSTWDLLLPGLATASERELLMLLDAIEATAPLAGIAPLLTRAATERPGPLRRRISDVLYIYSKDQQNIEINCSLKSIKVIENPYYTSYLTSISGKDLVQYYDEYGKRLLESNVRTFLSLRGKINKGIYNTINSDNKIFFFAYNNGLSGTASDIKFNNGIISNIKNLHGT